MKNHYCLISMLVTPAEAGVQLVYLILKNAVERNANIVGPHPRPFSRREKGANPLSLWERVGVRAKPSPNLVFGQFVALN
jgi:hypothetical protein